MKYDSQLTELKNIIPTSKNILITMPANANIDTLASGLSLFLTLQATGKEVSIVCETDIKVGQSHLFGVDHISKTISATDGGNLTLTLEGVAASDNTIPALEKLDWYAENNNLNLVFHVLPGQTFTPAKIVPKFSGSGFDLIFVIGAVNLNALGNIYSANQQAFSGIHIVNIDNQSGNLSFGQTNVLDSQSSSLSEMMSNVLVDLGFVLTQDVASNLIAGIFDATVSLTNEKANAETYMAVAQCLRVGGRKPSAQVPSFDWSALMPASTVQQGESKGVSVTQPDAGAQPAINTQTVASIDSVSNIPEFAMPTVAPINSVQSNNPVIDNSGDDSQSSPEERPYEEGVVSETVEPEWLTPKIFKGSSIG